MFEMQTLERKREYNQKAQNTMQAFLNMDGGTLYIGIANDCAVYGVDGNIDELARSITNNANPRLATKKMTNAQNMINWIHVE